VKYLTHVSVKIAQIMVNVLLVYVHAKLLILELIVKRSMLVMEKIVPNMELVLLENVHVQVVGKVTIVKPNMMKIVKTVIQ